MSADLLDRVRIAADDLLSLVDTTLIAYGAPADHPVWPAVRRVGALPHAAVTHLEGLDAGRLRAAASQLRSGAGKLAGALAGISETSWTGAGSEAYARTRTALCQFSDESDARLRATSDHIDAVADWVDQSRETIARRLAACLSSTEAVLIRSGDEAGAAQAAADLAARILDDVAGCVDAGWRVHADWHGALSADRWRGPDVGGPDFIHQIEVR